jgi:uncharacterized membrane protein YedE/YeeE
VNALAAFAAGLVFGLGLILSGMSDPGKVKGFLDLAGAWDPSLAFVMAGAIGVGFFAFRFAGRRAQSFLGGAMRVPSVSKWPRGIDLPLVAGSVVFGIGWGLSGFCPGPALVALGAGYDKAFVFVLAMLAGMLAWRVVTPLRSGTATDLGSGGGRDR